MIALMKRYGLTLITHNINIHIGAIGPCKGCKGGGRRVQRARKGGEKGGDCGKRR